MAYTIPPNTRTTGSPAPAQDMDNTADMLGLLTRTISLLAIQAGAADPAGNFGNTTAVQGLITNGLGTGQQQLAASHAPALIPWYAGLANRQTTRCNVVCIGDSITEGQHGVGPPGTGFENKWVSRLRDLLRARYPTPGLTGGGRGYINVNGTGETSFTWPTTITGTPASVGQGPKGGALQVSTGQPGPIVFNLTGDSADIMWVQVFGGGSFTWKVDAGSTTTVSTNGGSTVDGKITHISLGSAGAHTVTLQWASGGGVDLDGVVEYNGDFALGLQVHDCGHFGWQTSSWVTSLNSGSVAGPAAAIAALSPNLVIISLGVNDQFSNVVPATFQANLQTIITDIKARLTAPYPAIVLNMYPARTGQGGYTYPWSQYTAAAWNVAQADTSGPAGQSIVSVMDWTLGPRMPGADTDVYGFWQAADLVHPSNLGHQAIADGLAEFLSWR